MPSARGKERHVRRKEQGGAKTEQTGSGDQSMRMAPLGVRRAFLEVTGLCLRMGETAGR